MAFVGVLRRKKRNEKYNTRRRISISPFVQRSVRPRLASNDRRAFEEVYPPHSFEMLTSTPHHYVIPRTFRSLAPSALGLGPSVLASVNHCVHPYLGPSQSLRLSVLGSLRTWVRLFLHPFALESFSLCVHQSLGVLILASASL